MAVAMSKVSRVIYEILTLLLLSIMSTACGRVALTPQLRQDSELRTFVIGMRNVAPARAADESELDGPAGTRLVRRPADDSSIEDARATRSGWAASEGR
jgi:hypothetical protein